MTNSGQEGFRAFLLYNTTVYFINKLNCITFRSDLPYQRNAWMCFIPKFLELQLHEDTSGSENMNTSKKNN